MSTIVTVTLPERLQVDTHRRRTRIPVSQRPGTAQSGEMDRYILITLRAPGLQSMAKTELRRDVELSWWCRQALTGITGLDWSWMVSGVPHQSGHWGATMYARESASTW